MDCSDSPPLQILDLSTPYSSAFTSFCRSSAGAAACAVTMLISAAPWRAGYDPVALGRRSPELGGAVAADFYGWFRSRCPAYRLEPQRFDVPHNRGGGRRIRKSVRLLYCICCGQRGGRGRVQDMLAAGHRIGAVPGLHSRVVRWPAPASRSGLFLPRFFGLFTQDYTGCRIHMVDLAARETGHGLIDVVILGDVFGNKALHAVSGLGAAVDEEGHGLHSPSRAGQFN